MKTLICFLFLITGSVAIAKECPPKDTHVCTLQEGADKGRQLVVIQYRTKIQIRTRSIYGVVMKKTAAAPIDQRPLDGSGLILRVEGSADEIIYRFANLEPYEETNNLKVKLKRGTVVVLPHSGMGFYDFDGSRKSIMTCVAKYFAQINPHNKDAGLTDEDICNM